MKKLMVLDGNSIINRAFYGVSQGLATRSGQPSPKSADDVLAQLGGRIDGVLDGGVCSVGVESTILDLTVTPYRILRRGGLGRERLEAVLGPGRLEAD